MADAPKNIREINLYVTGALKTIDERVGVFQVLVWTMIGTLASVLVAAFANFYQISDVKRETITQGSDLKREALTQAGEVKTEIGILKTRATATDERLARIEKGVDELRGESRQILTAVTGRQPSDPVVAVAPPVTDADAQLIRQWIKTQPITSAAPSKITVGQTLPEKALLPLPDDVVFKLPKLKGVRYAIDEGNNLIALADGSGRVFALI